MSAQQQLSARDEGGLQAFLERGNLLAMAKAFEDAGVGCIEDVLQLEAATIQQITEGKPAWATKIKQLKPSSSTPLGVRNAPLWPP